MCNHSIFGFPEFDLFFTAHDSVLHVTICFASFCQLDQAWFGMPDRSYYLDKQYRDKLQAYQRLMMNVAIYLGAEPDQAMRDVQEITDFEIELANVS